MIEKMFVNCDLSFVAIEDAATRLPATKLYRLQIHPDCLQTAKLILREVLNFDGVNKSPFAPLISVDLCPAQKRDAWALWSGDDCIWSPGA